MIDRGQTVRAAGVLLAIAACVNIAAGVTLALADTRRAVDLWTMVEWCRAWLLRGESLYAAADAATDYPPNAIVLLSPLALVPHRLVVPLWIAAALTLTPLLPWLIVRCASGGQRRPHGEALPILLYLCWAAPRTLLQFSVLSMTLAAVALSVVDTRRVVGGIALGLALFKPHLAGPVALWMLLSGRIVPLTIAAATALLGVAAYDLRIGEAPTTTIVGWWRVLGSTYAGPTAMVGRTSIRAWVSGAGHGRVPVDVAWIAISAALLLALCVLAWRDRTRALASGGLAIPAMFSLWSLLAVYHNGNNMILMLPAFAFLWFVDGSQAMRWRWIPLTLLQGALAFDVPVRLNHAAADGWASTIEHVDRLVVLATLALVAAVWWRLTAVRSTSRASRHDASAD